MVIIITIISITHAFSSSSSSAAPLLLLLFLLLLLLLFLFFLLLILLFNSGAACEPFEARAHHRHHLHHQQHHHESTTFPREGQQLNGNKERGSAQNSKTAQSQRKSKELCNCGGSQRRSIVSAELEREKDFTILRRCNGPVATDGDCYWVTGPKQSPP